MNTEEAIKHLETQGYKVTKKRPIPKLTAHDEMVRSTIASYLSHGVTVVDLASDNGISTTVANSTVWRLAAQRNIKCVGRRASASTGHVGKVWVASQYAEAAKRAA